MIVEPFSRNGPGIDQKTITIISGSCCVSATLGNTKKPLGNSILRQRENACRIPIKPWGIQCILMSSVSQSLKTPRKPLGISLFREAIPRSLENVKNY